MNRSCPIYDRVAKTFFEIFFENTYNIAKVTEISSKIVPVARYVNFVRFVASLTKEIKSTMPQTRSTDSNLIIKKILRSPPVHHLRSTSQQLKGANVNSCSFIETNEDVYFRNDEKQRKRTQSMPSNSSSQKLRSKPINKFLEDNESYYKIEILSGKLRSSSSSSTPYMLTSGKRSHDTSPNKPHTSKNSPKKPQFSNKTRTKTRTKEITVLNREAVHFLFPSSPEDDESDVAVVDSDGSNSSHDLKKATPKTPRKVSKKVIRKKIKLELKSDNEEDVINDDIRTNCEHYESSLPKKQYSVDDLNIELNFDHIESDLDDYLQMNSIQNEVWYQTFQRHDHFDEDLSKPSFLSNHMISLVVPKNIPPKDQTSCREYWQNIITMESSETQIAEITDNPKKQRRKRYFKYRKLFNCPRKSPRHHASTLAILSALKRKESPKKAKIVPDNGIENGSVSNNSGAMNSLSNSLSDEQEPKNDRFFYESVKNIFKNESQIEINNCLEIPNCLNNFNSDSIADSDFNVIDILEHLKSEPEAEQEQEQQHQSLEPEIETRQSTDSPVRFVKMKRRLNRTGWPKKRKYYPKKSTVSNDGDFGGSINGDISESSNTDSNSIDVSVKKSPEPTIEDLKNSVVDKYKVNLEKFEKLNGNDLSPSIKVKYLTNGDGGTNERYTKSPKLNYNSSSSSRLLRSASFGGICKQPVVNAGAANGDCSYRKLRSARHCFLSRTR